VVYAATGPVTQQFMVYLKMANQNPYITWVNQSAQMDPVDSNSVIVQLYFNVTDPDGYADLNPGTANMTLNDSEFNVTATSCSSVQNASNWGLYNCSFTMKYWYNATDWQINASISDDTVYTANSTESFTYNELSAMQLPSTIVNFTGVSIGDVNESAPTNPFIINNTGNDDFNLVNMSGSDLKGQNVTTQTIGVANISINWTGNTGGLQPMNNTNQTLTGLTLPHGEPPTSNRSINFYITIPSDSGLTVQNYNATRKWTITVFDTS